MTSVSVPVTQHRNNSVPGNDDYDVILIGSGMGALTVASLLAQLRGKRVLVLEQHFKIGGFTHDFMRGRFHWDVGLHYVGEMEPGNPLRSMFDLVTRKRVDWTRMPEPFERFSYPHFSFDVYGDAARYQADLCERFPMESRAIRRYFRDVQQASQGFVSARIRDNMPDMMKWVFACSAWWSGRHLGLTTQTYLNRNFRDPFLKSLLVSQWGDYGLPPAQSSFGVHSVVVNHYLRGAYYPTGGAGTIAKGIRSIVEQAGGAFLVNHRVKQILIESGRAVGVQVARCEDKLEDNLDGPTEEFRAPIIISNAGAVTTFLRLLPESVPFPSREKLAQFIKRHPPTTNVSLFVGLNDDPRLVGANGGNMWIFDNPDHDKVFHRRWQSVDSGRPEQVYASFPSIKDPSADAHTAELITFAEYNQFADWKDQPWRQKDADYQSLKERISDGLIALVNSRLPGFADMIEFREMATPLTNAYFTGHAGGGIYGLSAVPERFTRANIEWRRTQTSVPGLYLTGADLMVGGIVSAMMSGILTLNAIPGGIRLREAFGAAIAAAK